MGSDMAPDTWTTPELVRAVQRIERAQAETLAELRAQRADFLLNAVYTSDQKSLDDYKVEVAKDLIDLGAEQARVRRDMASNLRWAIGTAIAAAGVSVAGMSFVMDVLGLGA